MTTKEAYKLLEIKTPIALINLRKDGKITKAYQPGGRKWVYDEEELKDIKEQMKKGRLKLRYY